MQRETSLIKGFNWTIATLLLIVAIGLFFRIYDLGRQSLWIDEGYTIHAAQNTLEHGYPLLGSGKIYDNGPLATYKVASSIALFSFDPFSPWSARLPSAIAGGALIILVFLLARRFLGDDKLALVAALIISLSEWVIAWSRQARGYAMLAVFITLSIYLLIRLLETKKIQYGIFALISFVLAYLSHGVAIAFLPALLAISIPSVSKKISQKHILFGSIGLSILFIIIPFGPDGFGTRYLSFLAHSFPIIAFGALSAIALSLFERTKSSLTPILGTISILYVLAISQSTDIFQLRYLFPLFPVLVILFIYALQEGISHASKKFSLKNLSKVAPIVIFILSIPYLTFIPRSHYDLESGSPQPDFKSAFELIQNTRIEGDIVISPYAHLHSVYLGEKGVWLSMSLTGKREEIAERTIDGKDYYAGAPAISGVEGLSNVVGETHGFVIIDRMARIRLPGESFFLMSDPRVEEVFSDRKGMDDSISVYRF